MKGFVLGRVSGMGRGRRVRGALSIRGLWEGSIGSRLLRANG